MFRHDKYHLPGMTYGEASIARAKGRAEAKEQKRLLLLKVANSPITAAVAPLKIDAEQAAEDYARSVIVKVDEMLKAHGYDRELAAPYPKSRDVSRFDFQRELSKYQLVRKLTVSADGRGSRRFNEPDVCKFDDELVAKFIVDCREEAAAQYEKFVCKLVHKIGDCSEAKLDGNHVWHHSVLTVTKPEGVEKWQTKQITNCSVLGKYFPQWPSRKMK